MRDELVDAIEQDIKRVCFEKKVEMFSVAELEDYLDKCFELMDAELTKIVEKERY